MSSLILCSANSAEHETSFIISGPVQPCDLYVHFIIFFEKVSITYNTARISDTTGPGFSQNSKVLITLSKYFKQKLEF